MVWKNGYYRVVCVRVFYIIIIIIIIIIITIIVLSHPYKNGDRNSKKS